MTSDIMNTSRDLRDVTAGLQPPAAREINLGATESRNNLQANTALELILESNKNFTSLNEDQKNQILKIADNLDASLTPSERANLIISLITRTNPDGSAMISPENKFHGKSLLGHLEKLCDSELTGELKGKVSNSQILTSVLQTLQNIGKSDQGLKVASCTAANLEWHLAKHEPVVFAGLICDLSITGKTLARNGDPDIKLGEFINDPTRSPSGCILQTAMFRSVVEYDAQNDLVKGKHGAHTGMYCTQVEQMYEKFTGLPMQRLDNKENSPKEREKIKDQLMLSIKEGQYNMACVKGIGSGTHSLHAIGVTEIKDGFVFYRNPWGEKFLADGSRGGELVNARQGIYKMREDDFLNRCTYVIVQGKEFGATAGANDEIPMVMEFTELQAEDSKLAKTLSDTKTSKKDDSLEEGVKIVKDSPPEQEKVTLAYDHTRKDKAERKRNEFDFDIVA